MKDLTKKTEEFIKSCLEGDFENYNYDWTDEHEFLSLVNHIEAYVDMVERKRDKQILEEL